METANEHTELMKTPRRTRSLSRDVELYSQKKRSIRKPTLPEIEESEVRSVSNHIDPVTPSRSFRVLDFQSPSRSESMAEAQTPRRSVRKSIKPVQDYDDIVAHKALSSKKTAQSTSVEEDAEGTSETKWVAAVIGRVSSKRGKKARRTKNKQLQRQQRIDEAETQLKANTTVVKAEDKIELNEDDDKKIGDADEDLNSVEMLHSDDVEESQPSDEILLPKDSFCIEKDADEEKESMDEIVSQNENKSDDKETETNEKMIEEKPFMVVPSEDQKENIAEEEDEVDSSIEGGDVELAAMPVTADDFMDSPEKPFKFTSKNESMKRTSLGIRAVNQSDKSDDSDVILLSFNDSSNTETIDETYQRSGTEKDKNFTDSSDSNSRMPPLVVCSDDEDEKEGFNTEDKNSINLVSPAKEDDKQKHYIRVPSATNAEDSTLNITFDAEKSPAKNPETIDVPQTPVFRPSISRILTPFKSSKAIIPDIIVEPEEELDTNDPPEILLESREFALKGSRKRSFSVCVDRPKKVVTFHSPANTTLAIYDDNLMDTIEDANNITQRRKRSLSVTETDREMLDYCKQKRAREHTPDKRRKTPTKPSSKTKIPNFAAIHQQQFQRMESISDHIARRAERAKILTNLNSKGKTPASIQKGLPVKNTVLHESNKDGAAGNKGMPKARQGIELSGIDCKAKAESYISLHNGLLFRSKSKQDLSTKADASTTDLLSKTKPKQLPKPKFNLLPKPTISSVSTFSTFSMANTTIGCATQAPSNIPDPRPRFNLSTAIDSQAAKSSDKLGDRRKRYTNMYKSRSAPRTGENEREILKGVRTNRRFELQMMCRNRPN